MECTKCSRKISSDEDHEHFGQILCDDCYMDALSPTRTCDPWAVHSAKTLEQHSGSLLTELQKRILDILRQTGGITPGDLAAKLGIPFAELEREFASLRHMEKARAQMKDGSKILVLW